PDGGPPRGLRCSRERGRRKSGCAGDRGRHPRGATRGTLPADRARGDPRPRREQLLARARDRGPRARLRAPVRAEGRGAARRAHPPRGPGGSRADHPSDGRARLLRHVGAGGVRRAGDGEPGDDRHDRGALGRVARRRGKSHHAPGDPDQSAPERRYGGAEGAMAATHRGGRDHGGDLGHRARHRFRRRVRPLPRGARGGWLVHLGGQGVVYVRGAGERDRAPGAHEAAATYASERKQFGLPIGEFQLTQFKLGRMATHLAAARQLTYAAARAMDADEKVSLEPAMAKLFASDVAVWVTQEGQLLHGGWGYAEEFPISRHVVDALVLPIFEGVKPILELKVIARQLLGG